VFGPYKTNSWSTMTVTIGGTGDPARLAGPAREVVRAMDPRLPVVNLGPVSQFIDGQLARPRFGVMCAAVFGLIGLALAAFGTFAVLSLLVAQRTREIGIRMALGARERQIVSLVARQSLIPALVGCIGGGLAAAWLSRLLSSQLFGVTAHDPRAFVGAVGLLVASAILASWWPTRRAARVNPIIALRGE
jgi:putative ABC transport system permease protein